MQDVGTFENGVAKGDWTILPRLGTGDLRRASAAKGILRYRD